MKRAKLYDKTIGILVDAYFNDTLVHHSCYACAVGNIVAANIGAVYTKDKSGNFIWQNKDVLWQNVHTVMNGTSETVWNMHGMSSKGEKQIKATGYNKNETALIELAFETADKGNSEDEYMFNGLMAVVDCLDKIHEADNKQTQVTKQRFKKAEILSVR